MPDPDRSRLSCRGSVGIGRIRRALGWRRVVTVALVAVLLSLSSLASPGLLDFLSPAEIARAWVEHLVELLGFGAVLLLAYALADEALPRGLQRRLAIICGLLLGLAVGLTLLLHAYYAGGFAHLPPPLRLLSDALRWGLPAVFLALLADMHRRAWQADAEADASTALRARLLQSEGEQQLAALQAQIEPHFLFNILGNVRSLYRTQPQAGAEAMANLMRYLRSALPQLRSATGTLGDELAVARAYLELFRIRMGDRLTVDVRIDAGLLEAEFPPMLLVTLVENAIKHGLEPAGGGRLLLRAVRRQDLLEVAVLDDGVGFSAMPGSGTGVGLANVRRQLATRYPGQGHLQLRARQPRGAAAIIAIPLRHGPVQVAAQAWGTG